MRDLLIVTGVLFSALGGLTLAAYFACSLVAVVVFPAFLFLRKLATILGLHSVS